MYWWMDTPYAYIFIIWATGMGLMMGKMAAVINEEMGNEPVGTFLCRD